LDEWNGEIKKGKKISHRYDRLPLLPSDPGGIQRELVVSTYPGAKIQFFFLQAKGINNYLAE